MATALLLVCIATPSPAAPTKAPVILSPAECSASRTAQRIASTTLGMSMTAERRMPPHELLPIPRIFASRLGFSHHAMNFGGADVEYDYWRS